MGAQNLRVGMALANNVLEQVRTGVIALDHGGLIAIYNAAAQEILGVPVERVLWRSCASLAAGDEPLRSIAAVLSEGQTSGRSRARMQLEVDTGMGHRTLGYGLTVLGDSAAVGMIFTDLTETLERERRTADERHIAEAGRLASAMAHELKSPLATIGLYVDLLRRQLGDNDAAAANLEVIGSELHDCQSRLSTILHSMAGQAAADGSVVLSDVAAAVEAVVREQRLRAPDADLRLEIRGGGRVALSVADVSSIVGNLVTNAVQAAGGDGPIEVTVVGDGDDVVVAVADHGPGLPDGDVFAPFFSTKAKGTGLGLWLVRRVAVQAGGNVTAGAGAGGGALFTVRLPVARRELLAGRRLAVVDDDTALVAAVAAAFEESGAVVTAATSAEEFLDAAGADGLNAVVIDYRLPGIDGAEAAGRLPVALPVLLVSSDPTALASLHAVGKERAWFMAKPFAMDDLLDTVSLLVDRVS